MNLTRKRSNEDNFVAFRGVHWHGRKGNIFVRCLRLPVLRQDVTLSRTSVETV
jgi:hypothetical protein